MIYVGSGDFVVVRADANDPDNDPLTYSWTTNGGSVEGNGSEARWNSCSATPGTYTVKVRVDDGRGGSADCSSAITRRAAAQSASGYELLRRPHFGGDWRRRTNHSDRQ